MIMGMRDVAALVPIRSLASYDDADSGVLQRSLRRRRMYKGCRHCFTRLIARNRRRYGGYIVHMGVVVIFAALRDWRQERV